jgi:hypothetical protein
VAKSKIKVGKELMVVGCRGSMVRLVPRRPTEEASGGDVVGHTWQVVAAVGLSEEVGDGHIVQGAGKRVQTKEIEHGDIGRDL